MKVLTRIDASRASKPVSEATKTRPQAGGTVFRIISVIDPIDTGRFPALVRGATHSTEPLAHPIAQQSSQTGHKMDSEVLLELMQREAAPLNCVLEGSVSESVPPRAHLAMEVTSA